MANFSQEAGAFFQTDAEIAKQKEKSAKYNYTEGDAIELKSKALGMLLDESTLYVAESGFYVRKINLTTGKTTKLFKGHQGPVTCVVKGDSDTLWTGSWDKTIKKWSIKTGECLATLQGHTDFVKTIIVVGDTLYSGSSDAFLKKWDLTTQTCLLSEKRHKRAIESLAVTPDGRSIFSASSDGTVVRWDSSDLKVIRSYEEHETSIYCVRVSGEDDLWTASADKTVRRWNIETGVVDMVLKHTDRVKSLVLSGPFVVTGSSDDDIRVWDIASGNLVCTIEGHFDEVGCLDFAGTTLYSGSLDCSIRRWSLTASAIKEYNETREKKQAKKKEQDEKNTSGLTEEEERELEELLMSDED
ncbi:WD40 repeat-like protein [Backusella circina FSU 941]|nr:WD40 repeat-like protein [Backusella circina FSU 941]